MLPNVLDHCRIDSYDLRDAGVASRKHVDGLRAHTKLVTMDRLLLLHTLQRAAILSNERFRGVRVGLAPGVLKIACTNNEQEEAEEEIEIAYEGGAIDIGFNINYMLDALATLSSNEITLALQDSSASVLFTVPGRTDFKYVVMPMRI